MPKLTNLSASIVQAALVEHHRSNRINGISIDTMMVSSSHVENLLQERVLMHAHLNNLERLLKRRPKANNSMYVGADKTPWGKQAAALLRNMREDLEK